MEVCCVTCYAQSQMESAAELKWNPGFQPGASFLHGDGSSLHRAALLRGIGL